MHRKRHCRPRPAHLRRFLLTRRALPALCAAALMWAASACAGEPNWPDHLVIGSASSAAASGNADDKSKVIDFLVAMGQEADHSTTPDALTALVAKVEAVVATDVDKQKRYMTEAVRAGFAAS